MVTQTKEHGENKKTTTDNRRYLINYDQYTRRRNVLLFGLPDDDEITVDDEDFSSGDEAVSHTFEKLQVNNLVRFTEVFRLG